MTTATENSLNQDTEPNCNNIVIVYIYSFMSAKTPCSKIIAPD